MTTSSAIPPICYECKQPILSDIMYGMIKDNPSIHPSFHVPFHRDCLLKPSGLRGNELSEETIREIIQDELKKILK